MTVFHLKFMLKIDLMINNTIKLVKLRNFTLTYLLLREIT